MLPKHRSERDLEPPFQRTYFENVFGSRSIGEPSWKPHVRNALDHPNCQEHSHKGGNGLDWFSSIRCPENVEQFIPIQRSTHLTRNGLKTPITSHELMKELHPHKRPAALGYEERQDFTGIWEQTLEKSMGQKKKAWDRRNGLNERSPGDKSYYVPECAAKFHNHGSTLPSASFGALKMIPDTFIPLVKLPLKPRIPFHMKEQKKAKVKEIQEVVELDLWKAADPLRIS